MGRPKGSKNKVKKNRTVPPRANVLRRGTQVLNEDATSDSDDSVDTTPLGDAERAEDNAEDGDVVDENDLGWAHLALANRPPPAKLHHTLKGTFIFTANYLAKEYIRNPNELNLLAILALPKLGTTPMHEKQHTKKTRHTMQRIREGDTLQLLRIPLSRGQARAASKAAESVDLEETLSWMEQKKLQRLTGMGMFRKAANVVRGTAKVAQPTPEVLEELRRKHPEGTPHPFGVLEGRGPPVLRDADLLETIIDKLDRQTAAGLSGWSPELLKLAFGHKADSRGRDFRTFMWTLAKSISRGTAPGQRLLCASRLTPLNKPDVGGVRPITCGELFFRVCVRCILREWGVEDSLLPCQMGVGTKGGVEPICEYVQQILDGVQEGDTTTMYSLDSTNAFNTMSRKAIAAAVKAFAPKFFRLAKWAYDTPAPLVVGVGEEQTVLESAEGVRQGDPLGPFLFSLGFRPLLEQLKANVRAEDETAVVLAYLDDVFVISKRENLMDSIKGTFEAENRTEGIKLNIAKTRVNKLSTVKYGQEALPILGTVKGDKEARKAFINAKTAVLHRQLQRLAAVPKQEALTLLRLCFAAQNRHLLRSMDTSDLEEELAALDNELYSFLDELRDAPAGPRGEGVTRIYSFMSKFGGLGVLSHVETRGHAYLASIGASREELKRIGLNEDSTVRELGDIQEREGVPEDRNFYKLLDSAMPTVDEEQKRCKSQRARTLEDMQRKYDTFLEEDLTYEERITYVDNSSKIGMGWLHAISTNGKYRHLQDRQIAAALSIHTLTSQVSEGVCTKCGEMDSLTHYEACQYPTKQLIWQQRHNYIRDTMWTVINKDERKVVSKEPRINHNNHQRGDIQVEVAAGGQEDNAHFGVGDITVKSVLGAHTANGRANARAAAELLGQGKLQSTRAEIEAALQVGVDDKFRTYGDAIGQGVRLRPLVISSGGTLHKKFYQYIKAMIPDQQARRGLCTDVSIALVRARAELLMARAL